MHVLLSLLSIATAIVLHFTRCFGHPALYDAFMRYSPGGLNISEDFPLLNALEHMDRNRGDAQEHNVLNRIIVRHNRNDVRLRTSRRTKS